MKEFWKYKKASLSLPLFEFGASLRMASSLSLSSFIVRRYEVERTVIHYSSEVSDNKCRLTERRTWCFYPECSSEIPTKPFSMCQNLARKIEESL